MTPDAPSPEELRAADALARCDEALRGGGPPPDLPELRAELNCLLALAGLRPPRPAAPAPAEFAAAVADSGLIDPTPLTEYLDRPDVAAAATAAELAGRMTADGLLTPYQAGELLGGRGGGLVFAGRYRVLERLGAGGMGEVFLCEHVVMGHKVALKVLPADAARDPVALRRFQREARAAAALDHPNVVKAHDVAESGGTHYMVMEYVEGVSLHALVADRGPLPPATAADYARQAAEGLQHAYEAGLVHRDVKPANLLVTPAGVVKVLDLGLARFYRDRRDQLTAEHAEGAILGTVDFMAPEQAADGHEADARADIYSLGATLYFLLTGRPPLPGRSLAEKLVALQTIDPVPVRSVRPGVPRGLARVVGRMLARDPAGRYPTPGAAAAALRPWCGPPKRRGWAAAAALGVALGVGLWAIRPEPAYLPPPAPGAPTAQLLALRKLTPAGRAAEERRWLASLAAMDAWHRAEAVTERLTVVNPGLRPGDIRTATVRGRVTDLTLLSIDASDLGPVRGLPDLARLTVNPPPNGPTLDLPDLSPLLDLPALRGVALLHCGRRVDLATLARLPLDSLQLQARELADFRPLAGARVRALTLTGCAALNDLDWLRPAGGSRLAELHAGGTAVRSVEPLRGLPLRKLSVRAAPVDDLSPLTDCPLEELTCDDLTDRHRAALRRIPTLRTVNGRPAAEALAGGP